MVTLPQPSYRVRAVPLAVQMSRLRPTMIRLRRAKGPIPLIRFYEVELTPPDADRPWRTNRPVPSFAVKRRLFSEGFYERDVWDLLAEANQRRGHWVEHAGVRPTPDMAKPS